MPSYKSPDGRFELTAEKPSDHFMDLDKVWTVIDTQKRQEVASFYVSFYEDEGIKTVVFSSDGWEVLAKDSSGKVVERVDLRRLAGEE